MNEKEKGLDLDTIFDQDSNVESQEIKDSQLPDDEEMQKELQALEQAKQSEEQAVLEDLSAELNQLAKQWDVDDPDIDIQDNPYSNLGDVVDKVA